MEVLFVGKSGNGIEWHFIRWKGSITASSRCHECYVAPAPDDPDGWGYNVRRPAGSTCYAFGEAVQQAFAAQSDLLEALKAWHNLDYEIQSARVNGESRLSARDFDAMRKDAVLLTDAALGVSIKAVGAAG